MKRLILSLLAAALLAVGLAASLPVKSEAIIVTSSAGLNAHIIAQTRSSITVSWTPLSGLGYILAVNDHRVSNTWDPGSSQTRFNIIKGSNTYSVQQLLPGESSSVNFPAQTTTTVPTNPTTTVTTTPTTTVVSTTTVPNPAKGCFAVPSSCGFPDKTNTGVPSGTKLTVLTPLNAASFGLYWSGSLYEPTSANLTLTGLSIAGTIYVPNTSPNFTIKNSLITSSGGIGSAAVREAASGLTIIDSTITGVGPNEGSVVQTATSGGTLTRDQFLNCGECVSGSAVLTDSYVQVTPGTLTDEHYEDFYGGAGTTLVMNHNTLLNPQSQTAIFLIEGGGSCSNHITFTNNLAAGGGFMFYPCSGSSSAGSSQVTITNNRFARCLTSSVYNSKTGGYACSGGQDANGYWPGGGYFGMNAYTFCQNETWAGNVWDDNNQTVNC